MWEREFFVLFVKMLFNFDTVASLALIHPSLVTLFGLIFIFIIYRFIAQRWRRSHLKLYNLKTFDLSMWVRVRAFVFLGAFVNKYRACVSVKRGGWLCSVFMWVSVKVNPQRLAVVFFKEVEKMCDKKAFHPWVTWLNRGVLAHGCICELGDDVFSQS